MKNLYNKIKDIFIKKGFFGLLKSILRKIFYGTTIKKLLLKRYIKLHNKSYGRIGSLAKELNSYIHPKHEIMKYHKYFVRNVDSEDKVIDIGCGNGFLSYDISKKAKVVMGIDINKDNIWLAKSRYKKDNLVFLQGDALEYEFAEKKFDKIVLSNVLEHIENRVEFLRKLRTMANTIILRVPMITRDWTAVYKKEKGYEYRLDKTHYIEYTLGELREELTEAGWRIDSSETNWGEFWGIIKNEEN